MSKTIRLFAILQLCFAFSLILWVLAQPFTVEHFNTHSSLLLYQTATGKGDRFVSADKLARHAQRFAQLEPVRQERILNAYADLEKRAQRPFLSSVGDALSALLWDLPAFALAWILFSVVISVLLLLDVEGATQAVWLLPLITFCYAIDNQMNGRMPQESPDAHVLPTEDYLTSRYGQDLKQAWELYLMREWAKSTPPQIEDGEHALTVARVEQRLAHPEAPQRQGATKKPLLLLSLFCVWNLLVAIKIRMPRYGKA
jgi:hypothetical protein